MPGVNAHVCNSSTWRVKGRDTKTLSQNKTNKKSNVFILKILAISQRSDLTRLYDLDFYFYKQGWHCFAFANPYWIVENTA